MCGSALMKYYLHRFAGKKSSSKYMLDTEDAVLKCEACIQKAAKCLDV